MKAVISVIGTDKIGIIAKVTTVLAESYVNILDISQTIMSDYFTMIMVVDLSSIKCTFNSLKQKLEDLGDEMGLSIKIQHQDIFDAMHNLEYRSNENE